MSSTPLKFSLALNLILLGLIGLWVGKNHAHVATETAPVADQAIEKEGKFSNVAATPGILHWSEIESADYPTYVANLRKAGCPERVLRRIITADLKELYARKAFALTQEFHRDFWEIAAREDVREYFGKTFAQKIKALCDESDAVLKQLVGEAPGESPNTPATSASEIQLADFLSPDKQKQLRGLAERYEVRMKMVRHEKLSPEEKEFQLAELRREMESEQARILSPEELAEYQLRQSSAAKEVQQLYGVDFSETELRNLAKTIDKYDRRAMSEPETESESLDKELEALLGAERFADFNRARSASYRELYEVAADFGLSGATAAEVFDLRLESEKVSDAIRVDKSRTATEKQALLDQLEEQVEQSVSNKLGAEAYRYYKAASGRWLHSLGKL